MNHKYLTVTALNQYINKKFVNDPYLNRVYLTGEISNWRKRPNHQYFSLKDDKSVISAVMWKGQFNKVKFEPEEGMKVLVTGRVSTFAKSGQYQVYIDSMQPDGVGNLYVAYEQLKKKLYAEGLFNPEHKQIIPKYPKRIAVITSESGSVIRDIIDAVRKRDPKVQVVLFPAAVQGEKAADEIAAQIKRVNKTGDFDTLIIGRGGGSIEDLWPFNEEKVARAIYDSKIPVISSVGHQTDTTIADQVADVRASTPTQAGVIATPVLNDVLEKIRNNQNIMENAMGNIIKLNQRQLDHLKNNYVFQHPERLYEAYTQQKDILFEKLINNFKNIINEKSNRLKILNNKLFYNSPRNLIDTQRNSFNNNIEKLQNAINDIFHEKDQKLKTLIGSLDDLSPLKIMSRGYSVVKNDDGQVIKSIKQVSLDEKINVNVNDGILETKVDKIDADQGEKNDN